MWARLHTWLQSVFSPQSFHNGAGWRGQQVAVQCLAVVQPAGAGVTARE